MNKKEELVKKLRLKLKNSLDNIFDECLREQCVSFYEGQTKYTNDQRFLVSDEIQERIPNSLKFLGNVLRNRPHEYSLRLSNANGNNFPAYLFLQKLLEPASNDHDLTLVEYLVLNHGEFDEVYGNTSNLTQEERNSMDLDQGIDLFFSAKISSIENLMASFENRGVLKAHLSDKYTLESISQTITEKRYNYLTKLYESFLKNPECDEVISFVKQLPSNTWFDETIYLDCDSKGDFDELNAKYVLK